METVIGVFASRGGAEKTARELLDKHVPQDEIVFPRPISRSTQSRIRTFPVSAALIVQVERRATQTSHNPVCG
jgi:hypothetical protein